MGTGLRSPVNWQNVSVPNPPSGKPCLRVTHALADLLATRRICEVHVSLTDERAVAAAFVILEGDMDAT
jgi:holo-[acyl-carrier protein] synthase